MSNLAGASIKRNRQPNAAPRRRRSNGIPTATVADVAQHQPDLGVSSRPVADTGIGFGMPGGHARTARNRAVIDIAIAAHGQVGVPGAYFPHPPPATVP